MKSWGKDDHGFEPPVKLTGLENVHLDLNDQSPDVLEFLLLTRNWS